MISWLTRTGTVAVATKYVGLFFSRYSLSKANTGDEVILIM